MKYLGRGGAARPCFPSPLHVHWEALLVWVVRVALLLNVSRTAGVTHWKLIDNDIMPEPATSGEGGESEAALPKQQDSVYDVSQFASTDPEFAMLIRYSARSSAGSASSANRGGAGFGSFRRQAPAHPSNSCASREEEKEGGEAVEGSKCPGGSVGGQQRKLDGGHRQPRNPDGSGVM